MSRRGHVAIIGAGRIGQALGLMIGAGQHPYEIRWWDSQPGRVPNQQPVATTLAGASAVLLAIPAAGLPSLADILPTLVPTVILIVISKGTPTAEFLSPFEYLESICPRHPIVVIGGPMMAEEMSPTNPGQAVIAGRDGHSVRAVGEILTHPSIQLNHKHDPVSVSRAGVLKNIYGCISGMLDGLGFPGGSQEPIRHRLVEEFQRCAMALKIGLEVIDGPAGLGDFAVTVTSPNSRNRRSGETFVTTGQRDETAEAMHSLPQVAEHVGPDADFPFLTIADQALRDDLQPHDLRLLFAGGQPANIKTGPKKYATLNADMPTEPSLPSSHAALVHEYEAAGFHHVHIRHDTPKSIYPPHYHPDQVVLHVLEGELDIEIDGQHKIIPAGAKIDVAAERFHTTCVGPAGCIYLHAEKHVTSP